MEFGLSVEALAIRANTAEATQDACAYCPNSDTILFGADLLVKESERTSGGKKMVPESF